MALEVSNTSQDNEELYVEARERLYKAAWNDPRFRELVQQVMTVPIRQIMNKSVRSHLLPLALLIIRMVEMMSKGHQQLTSQQIRCLLRELDQFIKATQKGCTILTISQRQVAQEASEEMIESTVKAGTGQTLTSAGAAAKAGKSALVMGVVVDGTLYALYTARDYWKYKKGKLTKQELKKRCICNAASAVGSTTGGTVGAAAGAAIGTLLCPGFGTTLGVMAGNVIGGTVGATAGCFFGDILTARNTSTNQPFLNETDTEEATPSYPNIFLNETDTEEATPSYPNIPPEDTAGDEALARSLQEEENRRVQEWSPRQYNMQQEGLRSRRGAEVEEAFSNGRNVTDDELARQHMLEDAPSFAPPHPREDPCDTNLTSSDDLRHGGYGSNDHAPSDLHGVQQQAGTYEIGEGHGAELPTHESQHEEVEQTAAIPCIRSTAAVPFDRYNEQLQTVRRIHPVESGSHMDPPFDEFYPPKQEHAFGERQSPRHFPPYASDENDVISCRFPWQRHSRDHFRRNQEVNCLQNQGSSPSLHCPECSLSPVQFTREDSAVASNDGVASRDAVIQKHQECHQHPTHNGRRHFRKKHTKSSPNDGLKNHPSPLLANSSPSETTTSFSARSRRKGESIPAESVAGSLSTKPFKSGMEPSARGMTATTISYPYHTKDKNMYTAASKNSSRQYGALRDKKPADDSHCASLVSSEDKGSVRIVPSGRMPSSVHNGQSSQGKTQHNRHPVNAHYRHGGRNARGPMHSETATREPSSSLHSGTATREPSSSVQSGTATGEPSSSVHSMHSGTATREPSSSMHSGARTRKLPQSTEPSSSAHPGTATRELSSSAHSLHSGTTTREPSSSVQSGTRTRKLPQSSGSCGAGGGKRNPAQKRGRARQSYQPKNDVQRNSGRTQSYSSGTRMKQNGFQQ